MFVAAFTVVFFSCLNRSVLAAGPQLAVPPNVTMVTMNTRYVLRWDWDRSWSRDVTFTTQYISEWKVRRLNRHEDRWMGLCANLSRLSCDLSEASLLYQGVYLVRVRAEAGGSHSEWARVIFHPDRHARVGPPRVSLSHADGAVDVHIEDPVTSANASMRTLVPGLYYYILLWEGPWNPQSSHVRNLSSKANLVTLSDLRGGASYCVAVQTRDKKSQRESSFTSPLCIQTQGVTQWWVSVLCFLGSMVACFLLVFSVYKAYKWVRAVFFPSSQLPSHFKEYLCDSPGSDMPRLLTAATPQLCDKVVVCPRPVPEALDPPPEAVAAPPSGLEADSSQQGGSRDSGVYSSDSSQQTSGGSGLLWTGLCTLERRQAGLPLGGGAHSDVCL